MSGSTDGGDRGGFFLGRSRGRNCGGGGGGGNRHPAAGAACFVGLLSLGRFKRLRSPKNVGFTTATLFVLSGGMNFKSGPATQP